MTLGQDDKKPSNPEQQHSKVSERSSIRFHRYSPDSIVFTISLKNVIFDLDLSNMTLDQGGVKPLGHQHHHTKISNDPITVQKIKPGHNTHNKYNFI